MFDKQHLLYDVIIAFFNAVIDFFFREIQSRGSHLIPKEGPVVFVGAPHCNQFLDPLLLTRFANKRISFLCAQKSMDRLLVGTFAKLIDSIPVSRAQDFAFTGKGKIRVCDRVLQPKKIIGIHSQFTKDFRAGWQLVLPKNKGSAEITKIISDTELLIKTEMKSLEALELLTKEEGTTYKCVPYVDQTNFYKSVHKAFLENKCLGIFPEGGSHDRTQLLPLKAGIAIMTLGAMAQNPGLDVKIIPCGLNYFHPDKFRSRAVVEYGKPITIPKHVVDQYSKGGSYKREACEYVLTQVLTALKNITINTPDYETLMITQAARRLYKPSGIKLKMTHTLELNRKLVTGYLHFKDDPNVIKLKERILAYNALLKDYGIKDHQVKTVSITRARALYLLTKRLVMLSFIGVLAVPGAILNLPVIILAKVISKRKQKEALSESSVKVKARDVISSWKVIIGLVFTPILHIIYTVVACAAFNSYSSLSNCSYVFCFLFVVTLVGVSYYSVIFGTYAGDVYRSLRPLTLAIMGRVDVKELMKVRSQLSYDITEIIEQKGPEIFPDFKENKLVMPTGKVATPYAPLTPSSISAINWIMSPLEAIGEKLFSDRSGSTTPSVSRSSSLVDLVSKLTPLCSEGNNVRKRAEHKKDK